MTDLIKRLESATEGSRELDAWVHARGKAVQIHVVKVQSGTYYEAISRCGEQIWLLGEDDFPHCTTSLDAALTLVPEGLPVEIDARPRFKSYAVIGRYTDPIEGVPLYPTTGICWAATPTLAICIAAIKARDSAND